MKKILVVDPDTEILDVMNIILKDNRYIPLITTDYDRIYSTVCKEKPRIVILDVYEQPAHCKSICQKIKNDAMLEGTCIILFSTAENLVKDINNYHAEAYILKPFEINDVVKLLEKCSEPGRV